MTTSFSRACVNAAADWMQCNLLQLNSDKTEFMWCATVRHQHRLPTAGPLLGSSTVTPSSAVRDLAIYTDSGLTMQTTSEDGFAVLRCFTSANCFTSAAYRTSPGINFSVPVSYCCTRSFVIVLLQQHPVWTLC